MIPVSVFLHVCLLAVAIGTDNSEKEQEMAAHACYLFVTCVCSRC